MTPSVAEISASEISPSEAVGQLINTSDASVAEDLLERILAQPPAFLERMSVRLLQAMGYGGRESLAEHTGKPGRPGSLLHIGVCRHRDPTSRCQDRRREGTPGTYGRTRPNPLDPSRSRWCGCTRLS